jgi:hypothetical protein
MSLGWLISVIALVAGLYWFSQQPLQKPIESRTQLWLLLPELLAQHWSVDPQGESGWKYFPERFDLLLVAGATLAFAWGWGRAVTRRLVSPPGGLESVYWSLVTGLAVWGTLTLLLGLCGFLSRSVFIVMGLLPTLYEAFTAIRDRRPADADRPRVWTKLGMACAIAVTPFLLAMILGSLQPPNDFDVKEYHLEGVKEHYLAGRVGFLKHNVYTSFPFLTEMLCLSGMVLRGDWFRGALAGQAVLAAFAPITALGLFIAARRWLGTSAAWFAVLVHLSCPWTYRISIIAYAEGGLACFLLATFIATCRVLDAEDAKSARRWTVLTGLLAGAAAGCKYPGALTVVIPLGLVVVGASRTAWLRHGLLFSAGVLGTFGPWLAKNLRETGNPVYPLVYSVFGGADWDKASHAKWQAGHPLPLKDIDGLSWILRDTRDRLWEVFLDSDWQSGLYLGLAVAAGFVIWQRRSRVLVLGAIYGVFLFLSWQYLTHRIDRFWVPMLPVLSLLAGAGAAELWDSVVVLMPQRSWEVQGAVRALVAIPIFGAALFNLGLATSFLGGNNSYLMKLELLQQLVKTPAIALVESLHLSPADKVLFVGEAETFDAAFPYEYNTVFDHSIFEDDCSSALPDVPAQDQPLRPAAEIRQTWQARGITHIVVNWSEILRYRTTYKYTDFVHPRRFAELVEAGVLTPVAVPSERSFVPWENVASEKQREALQWAPELKRLLPGGDSMLRAFEVYRVVP